MKRERLLGRALSAVLVLFGFSSFAWAGACAGSGYDCVDLSGFDNAHPADVKTVRGINIQPQEIPNSGIIPASLGLSGKGGAITGNDNTKRTQLVEFNDLDVLNVNDQSNGLKRRFGGYGTYVFGDLVTTAASVIKSMPGVNITSSPTWPGGYINNGGIGGTFNSAKSKIKLPKGIVKDDIVFARLYWMGHLYSPGKMGSDLGNGENEYGYGKEKISATQVDIPAIKGYQDVKLKIENSEVYDITRENCQGTFAFVERRFGDGNLGGPRYNMSYTCSTEITDLVKANFKDYEDEIEITVGNINASKQNPHYQNGAYGGNMVWLRTPATLNKDPMKAWVATNTTYRLPYGGWYVVLVYDKTLRSQAELRGLDFPTYDGNNNKIPDDVKYSLARSVGISGDAKEYVKKHFAAKNVTIYDGLLAIEPTTPYDFGKPASYIPQCAISVDFPITGFFTPKSGDVQGKLVFAGFGANRGTSWNKNMEGLFVAKDFDTVDTGNIGRTEEDEKYHPASLFNGSKTWLEQDDDGEYELEGDEGVYNQALDMDEFDISGKLGNSQSSLALRLKLIPQTVSTTNRVFVPFLGVSIDLYVPELCYEERMYDTAGWLGFYNEDGTPKDNPGKVEDVSVVTGESLYYRTEFRNQKINGKDEEATNVYVRVNFGNSNTYVRDSSGIDNRLALKAEPDGTANTDDAEFVYLLDNEAGAYSTQALRAAGGGGDITSDVYKDKQLNSLVRDEFKFYIGSGAGIKDSNGEPLGGIMKTGDSAYVEFNATIGRTFTYNPIQYTAGYKMSFGGGEAIDGPNTIMERCKDEPKVVEINLLNGLKVVNQNYKDYCDGKYTGSFTSADYKCSNASDVNKTKSQDDRLYTQVAELPFDVNIIFKPDINDVFRNDCVGDRVDGKCLNYGENVCKNFGTIFKMVDGSCVPINGYEKLSDGTWGIKYKEGKLDGSLQKFILPGKLYLSAIRAGSGCKYIDNKAKIPFIVDGKRYMTHYDTDFINYQGTKQKLVKPVAKVAFEDAFNGVTFMFSYYPRGIEKPDTNTTVYVGEWNSTQPYNYDRATKAWTEVDPNNVEEYYIWVQTQMLYEKFIRGYKASLSEDEKRRLVEDWFNNPDNADRIAQFDDELANVEDEIRNARTFFGVEMSPDGSFHVCDSDSFVVRPAHFRVDMDAALKYAKLIDQNKTGDITEAIETRHKNEYRVGGDYTENADILGNMFYAESIKGHSVPNYNQIIGGNLGESRFAIRKSYDSFSLENALEDRIDMFRENKTYLRPFISNECYGSIENQAFFIEENIHTRSDRVYQTKDYSCANEQPTQYNGFEFTDGKYKLVATDVSKERNSTTRADIGKITINDTCTVKGHVFDTYYTKVWDKNANNLWANFGVKKVTINTGYAEMERFSPNELMAQALLEPQHKDVVPAALYTGMLIDKTSKNELGAVFNYFNVGDVLVGVYDNSWTDNFGDQTFDYRKGPDGEYWGATCILNSTSNEPNEFGKVGCDVGMKDNQELVLRYKPDRIDLAIEGLGMSSSRDKSTNPANNFVYYNSPDIAVANSVINGFTNKSMINQFAELGEIRFNGEAFLSDKIYKDTLATLYDGRILEGTFEGETYDVAKCGFANDMNVTINFSFDCNVDSSDSRCATDIAAADIKTTAADVEYVPFVDRTDIKYLIPAGTPYFTTNEQCAKNNGASDSRCFTYNVKSATFNSVGGLSSMTEYSDAYPSQHGLPLPINLAINYYTSANKDRGFINGLNATNNIYDPKNPFFTLLARAFNQGATDNARVFINFDRMQKSTHFPLYLLADDFNIITLANNGHIEPAKFNNANILVNQNGSPLIDSTNTNEFTDKPYKDDDDRYESFNVGDMGHNAIGFQEHIRDKKALTGLDALGYLNSINALPSILFVYGKANEPENGRVSLTNTTYKENVLNSPRPVDILDAVYCGRTDGKIDSVTYNGCRVFPAVVVDSENLSPTTNIFSELVGAPSESNLITNIVAPLLGSGTSPTIQDWVKNYISTSNKLEVDRNSPSLQQGRETILLKASNITGTDGPVEVRVITWPWLIYTPHRSDTTIDSDPTNNMGTPIQYYNYFWFEYFSNLGEWGGEGEVKDAEKEGDIGSFITGKDFQDIAKGENANEQSPTIRYDSIDW